MRLSFGTHTVELKSWETKSEMINFLAKCDAGSLLLGEDAEQEVEFYSAIVNLEWSGISCFGIGICSEGHGLLPHLLLLPHLDILLFGFNKEVAGVNIKQGKVSFRIKLDSLFRSFLYMSDCATRLGRANLFAELSQVCQGILVFHEIGVVALTEDGQTRWKYSEDIIMDAYVESHNLHLKFMDSPSVCLNIDRA